MADSPNNIEKSYNKYIFKYVFILSYYRRGCTGSCRSSFPTIWQGWHVRICCSMSLSMFGPVTSSGCVVSFLSCLRDPRELIG